MLKMLVDRMMGKNDKEDSNQDRKPDLVKSLKKNICILKEIFRDDQITIFREFENQKSGIAFCTVCTDGMVDKEIINENIIQPVMNSILEENISKGSILDLLLKNVILSNHAEKSNDIDKIVGSIIYGDTVLLAEGAAEAIIIDTKGWQARSVSEPETERVVRGPREGFIEAILINLSLIKRRIINPDLKFRFKELGSRTKTKICLCYIEGLVSDKILEELERRLNCIDTDSILETGYIEEFIKDSPMSPFKTIGTTERPDVAAAQLLEGRIVVLCDGTPFVLTLPFLFMEYFQVNEDYYQNFIFASFNRLLRMVGFFLSTSVPAVYISLITYHQEMIPTPLLLSVSAAREGVPFPTIFEALVMTVVFEILREAGTRLPSPIGQTISIVGALVLGEAAVTARVISAPMIIVIALTGLSSFLIPKMVGPLIITRLIFLILSSLLGLYGYIFGVVGLFIHLMSIRSFGIPYMMNTGSINKQDLKDMGVRAPWWYMYYRPKLIADKDSIRKPTAKREGKA